jgi:large subunit ribosomal protein L7/L12
VLAKIISFAAVVMAVGAAFVAWGVFRPASAALLDGPVLLWLSMAGQAAVFAASARRLSGDDRQAARAAAASSLLFGSSMALYTTAVMIASAALGFPLSFLGAVIVILALSLVIRLRRVRATAPAPETDVRPAPASLGDGGWSVWLEAAGDHKIPVISEVRDLVGVGLKQAKDLVDAAPCVIAVGVSEEGAAAAAARLTATGATASAILP